MLEALAYASLGSGAAPLPKKKLPEEKVLSCRRCGKALRIHERIEARGGICSPRAGAVRIEPVLCGLNAFPAGHCRRQIDLFPFRVPSRFLKLLEFREEGT